MSDAVSRDAVMHALQEWTYCCDAEEMVRALPAVQPDAAAIREAALRVRAYLDRRKRAYGMDQNYIHTYDASTKGEVSLIVADLEALIDTPGHVNETPKSEHDARDVLTPATKGDWQPIETAPKRRVIDLWSQEGERYPDAIWGVCGDVEGWTDANDHRSLEGFTFTNWRDRPAPPATKGGDA